MLKIVLISGGTGSIAIQQGFAKLYGYQNYRLDVLINAYDNGKSAGICRKVFDNRILGPSDLRKNQLTQYKIVHCDELCDADSPQAKLLALFELRITAKDYKDCYEKVYTLLERALFLSEEMKDTFASWLNYFFFTDYDRKEYRKSVIGANFHDFCLANIFYSSCAALQNYSLAEAGRIMSGILGLENRVHLVSDLNLFLKARTNSGFIIEDEGDIVTWQNSVDRINDIILEKANGEHYIPAVGEKNDSCDVGRMILDADIIVFSSGTQWSSLIPTYFHRGFKELVCRSQAKKYFVMNNCEDDDMLGCCADDLLDTVNRYLPLDNVTVVLNDNAARSMRGTSGNYRTLQGNLGKPGQKEHSPARISSAIMEDYFNLKDVDLLISDLDGTLWDEKGNAEAMVTGKENLSLFRGIIFSGNSYDHVYRVLKPFFHNHFGEKIYCDYGMTYFSPEEPFGISHRLSDDFRIGEDLIAVLEKHKDFIGKITLRADAIVTIKPLYAREQQIKDVLTILGEMEGNYDARIAGHTSIDVVRQGFSKALMLDQMLTAEKIDRTHILYIGNEVDCGNEACIRNLALKTLQVDDVFEMNMVLRTCQKMGELRSSE